MPGLNKSKGWGKVEGATLDDAKKEFERHCDKKPKVKTAGMADKTQD